MSEESEFYGLHVRVDDDFDPSPEELHRLHEELEAWVHEQQSD